MLFEASLLQVVQSDANRPEQEEENDTPAVSSAHSSAQLRTSAAAAASARALLSTPSADPLGLPVTPLTPASLVADEERALRFERLARVFFEEKNTDMARSYALKAIEIRREIKGQQKEQYWIRCEFISSADSHNMLCIAL